MLLKLKLRFFLILSLIFLTSCHTRWVADTFIKQKQIKEQAKKEKENKKRKEEYKQHVEKQREKNYNKQALSTKQTWDKNSENSKKWNKKEFHKKTLRYRIRKFFERFDREPKPRDGLYSKKQKKQRKGNLFQRIFKKGKKKK